MAVVYWGEAGCFHSPQGVERVLAGRSAPLHYRQRCRSSSASTLVSVRCLAACSLVWVFDILNRALTILEYGVRTLFCSVLFLNSDRSRHPPRLCYIWIGCFLILRMGPGHTGTSRYVISRRCQVRVHPQTPNACRCTLTLSLIHISEPTRPY